jgi:hypothetical protein
MVVKENDRGTNGSMADDFFLERGIFSGVMEE